MDPYGLQLGLGTQFKRSDTISLRSGVNGHTFTGLGTLDVYLSAIYHFSI